MLTVGWSNKGFIRRRCNSCMQKPSASTAVYRLWAENTCHGLKHPEVPITPCSYPSKFIAWYCSCLQRNISSKWRSNVYSGTGPRVAAVEGALARRAQEVALSLRPRRIQNRKLQIVWTVVRIDLVSLCKLDAGGLQPALNIMHKRTPMQNTYELRRVWHLRDYRSNYLYPYITCIYNSKNIINMYIHVSSFIMKFFELSKKKCGAPLPEFCLDCGLCGYCIVVFFEKLHENEFTLACLWWHFAVWKFGLGVWHWLGIRQTHSPKCRMNNPAWCNIWTCLMMERKQRIAHLLLRRISSGGSLAFTKLHTTFTEENYICRCLRPADKLKTINSGRNKGHLNNVQMNDSSVSTPQPRHVDS